MLSTMVSWGFRAQASAAMGLVSPAAWKRRFSLSGMHPLQFFRAQVITVWQCPFKTGRLIRKSAVRARSQMAIGPKGVSTEVA